MSRKNDKLVEVVVIQAGRIWGGVPKKAGERVTISFRQVNFVDYHDQAILVSAYEEDKAYYDALIKAENKRHDEEVAFMKRNAQDIFADDGDVQGADTPDIVPEVKKGKAKK